MITSATTSGTATRPLRSARDRDCARSASLSVSPPASWVVSATRTLPPPDVEIGMMIGRLGEETDPHDERDRVRERRELVRLLDLVAGRDQPGSAPSAAVTSASESSGIGPYSTPGDGLGHTRRDAASTFPTPRPRPRSSSTAPRASPCTGPTARTSHFGLEELRRNCPCAECRGLREQGRAVGPKPRSLLPLHRRRRRARRRLGPHDQLERRPRHRDLRLEHPAGLADADPRRLGIRGTESRGQALMRSLHRKRWCTSARTICPGCGRAK